MRASAGPASLGQPETHAGRWRCGVPLHWRAHLPYVVPRCGSWSELRTLYVSRKAQNRHMPIQVARGPSNPQGRHLPAASALHHRHISVGFCPALARQGGALPTFRRDHPANRHGRSRAVAVGRRMDPLGPKAGLRRLPSVCGRFPEGGASRRPSSAARRAVNCRRLPACRRLCPPTHPLAPQSRRAAPRCAPFPWRVTSLRSRRPAAAASGVCPSTRGPAAATLHVVSAAAGCSGPAAWCALSRNHVYPTAPNPWPADAAVSTQEEGPHAAGSKGVAAGSVAVQLDPPALPK